MRGQGRGRTAGQNVSVLAGGLHVLDVQPMCPPRPREGRVRRRGRPATLRNLVLVGLGDVLAPGGGSPAEHPGAGLGKGPAGALLELVVVPAETAQVAGTGQAALVEGHGVIEVAAPG